MTRVLVCGAAGRMGRMILAAIADRSAEVTLTGAIERAGNPLLGQDAGEVAGIGRAGVPIADDFARAIASADVAIDFTSPEISVANAKAAQAAGKALVIGSTGFDPAQKAELAAVAAHIPIVLSPNMSVGVNLMFKVAAEVARVLGEEYDAEIVEVHHRFKKDAPSGTAVRLAEAVAEATGRDLAQVGVYGRKGMVGERTPREIGVFAVRAGDVVGEHTLTFGAIGERFEIVHRAHSRDTFARGAVRAAIWLAGRKPGLYDMRDVLGL